MLKVALLAGESSPYQMMIMTAYMNAAWTCPLNVANSSAVTSFSAAAASIPDSLVIRRIFEWSVGITTCRVLTKIVMEACGVLFHVLKLGAKISMGSNWDIKMSRETEVATVPVDR